MDCCFVVNLVVVIVIYVVGYLLLFGGDVLGGYVCFYGLFV